MAPKGTGFIPFAQYAPDVSDYEANSSQDITNCYPQADGYGPVNTGDALPSGISTAAPSNIEGFFTARNSDGTQTLFVGTSTKLYQMSGGAYVDVSFQLGGIGTATITSAGAPSSTSTTTGTTYTGVFVTGGSGTSAQASVTVSSVNGVTAITFPSSTVGSGYKLSDTGLSCASSNIGSVSGFAFSIATLKSSTATTQSYSAIGSRRYWKFTQYNDSVIAVNDAVNPQIFSLTNSTAFQDLGGSPPQAGNVATVNGFVMLSDISGHRSRIQWSDLDNVNQWTAGVGQSDFQDLGDGGNVLGVIGFDFNGVVFQEAAARMLTYVGGDIVFQITKIQDATGAIGRNAYCASGNKIFWASAHGMKMMELGGPPTPIGKGRVDRTMIKGTLLKLNDTEPMPLMASDPRATRVYTCIPSTSDGTANFSLIYVYDFVLDKWSKLSVGGTFLGSMGSSGTQSGYNSPVITATTTDALYFKALSGQNLTATLETGEMGTDNQRIYVRGVRAISDAPLSIVFASVSERQTPADSYTYSSETQPDSRTGLSPFKVATRYGRAKVRISSTSTSSSITYGSTTWTYAKGIETDGRLEGYR